MVDPAELLRLLLERELDFFTGVPDSQLKGFCDYLMLTYGVGQRHIIAVNEGNAVGLAAGYHLATGKTAVVYMQNSGLGNAVNPITSLIDPKVYAIPVLFIVGWRGMPGVHDEPQHLKQGEITLSLLETLGVDYIRMGRDTSLGDIAKSLDERFLPAFRQGKSAAVVVEKGGLGSSPPWVGDNGYSLSRERAIQILLENVGPTDAVVSTTGKISREVYDHRERLREEHSRDFLTVGSMGHASMIALEIAECRPERRVWCLDGDGAVLMHAGAMALIGARRVKNLIHVVLNNCAHESVGGLPTIAGKISFPAIAVACGYPASHRVLEESELELRLRALAAEPGPVFLEIDVSNGSRADLGRPKTSPLENKASFMEFLARENQWR